MNALIIEDNELKQKLIFEYIKNYVSSTITVDTLLEGLQVLQKNEFQYIFLDHHLPDGKGTDVLPNIKEFQPNSKYISISTDNNIIERHKQLGYDDIIEHPFFVSVDRIFKTKIEKAS